MRRFFFVFVSLLAVAAAVLALAPWWLGTALQGAGGRFGLSFERYERHGYARFALHDVKVLGRDSRWQVTAVRLDAPTPLLWAWQRMWGVRGEAHVQDWSVVVAPRSAPSQSDEPKGWTVLQSRLRERVRRILDALPDVTATAGTVQWPGNELRFERARWRDSTLDARLSWQDHKPVDATASYRDDLTLQVAAVAESGELTGGVELGPDSVRGQVSLWGNPASLAIQFDDEGWVPRTARLSGEKWNVPGSRLRLGAAYESLAGAFLILWDGVRFSGDVDFAATPKSAEAPPLQVKARGDSDGQQFRITDLSVRAPWATATLSGPVEFDRRGNLLSGDSRFTLQADLARQPWTPAAGQVAGEATIGASSERRLRVVFQLTGNSLQWRDYRAPALGLAGELTWPTLRVDKLELDLGVDGRLDGAGEVDFAARTVTDGRFGGQLAGAWLARWLPSEVQLNVLAGETEFAGPWSALGHTGALRATEFRRSGLKPVALSANWRGTGGSLEEARLQLEREQLRLTLAGSGDISGAHVTLAEIARGQEMLWQLESPAMVRWREPFQLNATLAGKGGRALAQLQDERGEVELHLKDPPLDWLSDLFDTVPPAALRVRGLDLLGRWDAGGDAVFTLNLGADYALAPERVITIGAQARSDGRELTIENLDVSDGSRSFAHARGRLPVLIRPTASPRFVMKPDAPIELEAVTEPYREFWDRLASFTGARVINPEGRLTITGSLREPRGQLELKAESASFDETKTGVIWPAVQNLALHATAEGRELRLDEFSFDVDGQQARITGTLPLGDGAWERALRRPASVDWREADLQLKIADARLAPFARYLPRFLAPQGKLTVDLGLKPGGEVTGWLEINNAATRPIGSLGSIQELDAAVEFSGRRADLRNVRASIGGEPLLLDGWIELPPGAPPQINVTLRGKNIPIARQPGLVVRSDLDLKVATGGEPTPRLTGTLQLRDSLYVANLRSFVPGERRAGPVRSPPYFSVEPAPLNSWLLDVQLRGDRFLRVRTPLFRGLVSAQFRLGGTLGEPTAVGEARLDEGTVLFPFAGFTVDQGRVSLTADRPREPQLRVSGTALRYGYDLRMELTGTPSTPHLAFSARPGLTSEEILLLVMTGEPPASNKSIASTEGGGQQRFAQLGAYLGRNLFTTFGGDPGATERLTITTGERLSRQGQETLEVEYELGRRWSLVGEYDEYDDYNVGLKYKVLRRKMLEETDAKN